MLDLDNTQGGHIFTSQSTSHSTARSTVHRRPDIQGLRALAVLLVVAFHAGLRVPGGYLGVDIFFVISGFVITAMLHREYVAQGRIKIGTFYARRFKRLVPALSVMVTATLVISVFVLSPFGAQQETAKTAIGSMLLSANYWIAETSSDYFGMAASRNALLNTWSLSVEEQFYLVFPFVLALGWYLNRRFKIMSTAPFVLVALIGILSLALAWRGTGASQFQNFATFLEGFYSPLTRAWEFAAGALLALLTIKFKVQGKQLGATLGVLGLVGIAASAFLINRLELPAIMWTLIAVMGTALLILAGTKPDNFISRGLGVRPLTHVGDWSYSIYLWHWPFIVFAAALWPATTTILVLAAVLSFIPALASYYWIEQPCRQISFTSRRKATAWVAALVLIPIGLGGAVGFAATKGYWVDGLKTMAEERGGIYPNDARNCGRIPLTERATEVCTWNGEAAGEPIYLFGDSNAAHFSDAVIGAGEILGRPITISAPPGCLMLDFTLRQPSDQSTDRQLPSEDCLERGSQAFAWVKGQKPGVVILSHTQIAWDNSPNSIPLPPSFNPDFVATIESLQQAGHTVMLMQPMPRFDATIGVEGSERYVWDQNRCQLFQAIAGDCMKSMPLEYVDAAQEYSRQSIQAVADQTGAIYTDLSRALCDESQCSTFAGGHQLYRDSGHISVYASKSLAPDFADAIRRTLPTAQVGVTAP
jgi:peptidoglycan/LPS O-acetylase OafA/YrhL